MAIDASLVGAGSSASNSVTTAAGSCTTGNTLVAVISYDPGTTISSISDTAGNSYSLKDNNTSGNGRLAAYVCENATGHASNVLTVNFSGTAYPVAHLIKVTGAAAASYDSGSLASGTDSATPFTITSGTLAQAASCVIACCELNGNSGSGAYASSNFTMLSSEPDASNYWTSGVAKLVVSSTSAVTPSFTRSSEETVSGVARALIVFALKESSGGTAITPSVGSLALTGQAPTVTATGSYSITPAAGSLGLTGQAPSVGKLIAPLVAALTLTGQAPTVTQGAVRVPTVGALALTGNAPTVVNTGIPRIGGHGLDYDFINDGGANATTPSMVTTPPSIMLACVGRGILSDFSSSTVSDNKGNGNYAALTSSHAYTNYPSSGTRLYQGTLAAGGSGTTVSASKPTTSDEVTLLAVECLGVDRVVDQSWVEDLTSPNSATSVTTSDAALLVAFWWGDDSNGELNPAVSSGWTVLDHTSSLASNHVQGASAYRVVSGAGTYSIDWTPSTSQGAQLYLVALQAGPQIAPDAGTLALTGAAPNRIVGTVTAPSVASLALTGAAPGVTQGTVRAPAAGSLALSGNAATVLEAALRTPTAGALAMTGASATVTQADSRVPTAGSMSFAGVAPTVVITIPGSVTPPVGSLGLTGEAPIVAQADARTASVGQLALTGVAPLLTQGAYRIPSSGSMAITADGPSTRIPVIVTPVAGGLTVQGRFAVVNGESEAPQAEAGSSMIANSVVLRIGNFGLRTNGSLVQLL